jgi:hypothetical protein
MTFTDEELSEHLEGLAPPERSHALEREAADDPELRARLSGIGELFTRRAELAAIQLPPNLASRTLRRLEREGLVEAPATPVPEGLLEKTLERVEAEGLVAPAPRALFWTGWRVAAAALLAAGVGVASGYSLRGERVVERIARVEVPVVKETIVEVEKPVVREVVKYVDRPVDVVKTIEVEKIVEKPVEVVKIVKEPAEAPTLDVTSARSVDRWDSAARRWRPLEGKTSLRPGELLRGAGQATVTLGSRRIRLSEGFYLVDERRALESLSDRELARASGSTEVATQTAPSSAEPDDLAVPVLLALRASGLPEERSRAQQELELRWKRLGDPGPGVLTSISQFVSGSSSSRSGPPATAEAWQAWWNRVKTR